MLDYYAELTTDADLRCECELFHNSSLEIAYYSPARLRHAARRRKQERTAGMSNPALPPAPEPAWPTKALVDVAAIAAMSLECSRAWVALRNRHRMIVPTIALIMNNGVPTVVDPQSTPDLVKNAITAVVSTSTSFGEYKLSDIVDQPTLPFSSGEGALAISSLAAVRLVFEGVVVGALVVSRSHAEAFTERHMWTLRSCAHQATAAMQQATLLERYNVQSSILRALLGASNALISSLDVRDVFRAIIESVQVVIQFERAMIYRYDERSQTLVVVAVNGLNADTLSGEVIALGDSVSKAAQAARDARTWVGTMTAEAVAGRHTDMLRAGAAVSMLCVPLIAKGQLHGVMSLVRERGFGRRDVEAMTALSPFAAAALENAQLFQRALAARRRQEAIFASASDGIAVVNATMRLMLVNAAFARFLGADSDSLKGDIVCHAFGAAQGPENSANCLLCSNTGHCQLRAAFEARQDRAQMESVIPVTIPTDSLNPSYGPKPANRVVDFNVTCMSTPNGHPQLILLGRDITAQREVENIRSDNVHMVIHEITTPLQNVADTLTDLEARYRDSLDPKYMRSLQSAIETALSVSQLMDDLAVVAQRDAGSWQIMPQPADLAEQARKAVDEQRVTASINGKRLHLNEPTRPLPPAFMDPGRARQVARNLINNAIKYTPVGGQVVVTVYADTDYVWLRVEDNGMGIPEEEQQRIWGRGYRVPQSGGAQDIKGQGQGLAIVRIIIEAHGGVKSLESAPGKGSVFSVGFPRADKRWLR